MKKIYRFFIIIVLLSLSLTAKSQDAIGLTLMPQVPYGNLYNPAIPMSSDMFIGLGISHINLSLYNSSIKYDNIYNYENGVPVSLNAVKFINSLDKHDNFIGTDFSLDILRLGFRVKKLFFTLDCKVRYNGDFHYSRDFLGFFVNGNGNYMGDKYADMSVGVNMSVASEVSFGVQYQINDKLTVALRPKLLCGVANFTINDDGSKIYTDENTYDMIADVNLNVKMSSLVDLGVERMSEFGSIDFAQLNFRDALRIKDNFGYGIDFGASYTFNKHFGVALGVYDLGFIKWKNAKEKVEIKENVVVNEALCKDYNELMHLNLDFKSLVEDMAVIWGDGSLTPCEDYKTMLKTRVMLQGYYELMPMLRISAIGQMYYLNNKMRPSMTLAYSGSFFEFLNLTASYTLSKYSANSISAGLALCLGPLKIYAVSDNIMILSKRNAPIEEQLTSYEVANFRLGLMFSIDGKNK